MLHVTTVVRDGQRCTALLVTEDAGTQKETLLEPDQGAGGGDLAD